MMVPSSHNDDQKYNTRRISAVGLSVVVSKLTDGGGPHPFIHSFIQNIEKEMSERFNGKKLDRKRGTVTRHSSNNNATDRPEEGSALHVLVWDETRPGPNYIKVNVCCSNLGYQVYFC